MSRCESSRAKSTQELDLEKDYALAGECLLFTWLLGRREAARGATAYVTLEPCPLCAGAILQARLPQLVYGAADPKAGAVESLYRLLEDVRLNHTVTATGGVLAEECGELLRDFFAAQRRLGKK